MILLLIRHDPNPADEQLLRTVIENASDSIQILMFQNGVSWIAHATEDLFQSGLRLLVLGADLEARGLAGKLPPNIGEIDYDAFVDMLMDESAKIVSLC